MDPRRLEMLLLLSRLGSMREVADELGVTTSTVSQQLGVLATEAGTRLLEPDGRRVRLTPAGHRLAGHAVAVLAALEAARLDLDPAATPSGEVRVAAFASAIRETLLPLLLDLRAEVPDVRLQVLEHEPTEALDLLERDRIDLAVVYDYDLAPSTFPAVLEAHELGRTPWGLGVPARDRSRSGALEVFARYRDADWIVNSRNTADDEAVRAVASLAGFAPRIVHRADSLDLVQDLVVAGLGVGLLPQGMPTRRGVRVTPLREPSLALRSYVVTRRGREQWAPLALLLRRLREGAVSRPPGRA